MCEIFPRLAVASADLETKIIHYAQAGGLQYDTDLTVIYDANHLAWVVGGVSYHQI